MFKEAFEVNSKTPDLLVIDFVDTLLFALFAFNSMMELFALFAFNSMMELFAFSTISFALSDVEDPILILPLTSKLPVVSFVLT